MTKKQHEWEDLEDGNVRCTRCDTIIPKGQARRGFGPCPGKPVETSPVPDPNAWRTGEEDERQEESEEDYIKRTLNLCETCTKQPAECGANPKLGTGIGNDNVYECDGYIEGEKPAFVAPELQQYPGPKLTDPPEHCNACGDQLAILPLNSRLDMIACRNGRCSLYRERIRMMTKPVERRKRARSQDR